MAEQVKKKPAKKQAKASTKPLTTRRRKLVEELANPATKSIADAARKAGFAPSAVRSTVYAIVADPHISEAVAKRIQRSITNCKTSPEEVLGSAVFNMRASMDDLMDKDGFFDLEKARQTGAVDLIKEIEFNESFDVETGTKTVRHKVKFESPASARKEVANYINLENNQAKPEHSLEELGRQFLNYLLQNIPGIPKEKAVEAVRAKYGDVKLIEE